MIGEGVQLIDHHCHGVVRGPLDAARVAGLLTESPWPPPAGTSTWDSQLGFAVRRWCAPLLGLEPSAPPGAYLERRAELGAYEVTRRLLAAAGAGMWLVDTGYRPEDLLTPAEMEAASGVPAREVVRLEALAEQVARDGTSAAGFAADFAAALEVAAADAVGLKSVAAYRHGLNFDPSPPSASEVTAAAGRWLSAAESSGPLRLADPVLVRHVIWAGVETGLPVQFHTGFGDPDVRLHRANPALLHDFLLAIQSTSTPIMLLHCYPYHRQAAFLASVFPNVYLDVGLALNHVGARSAAVLAETVELAPFGKILYSSDGFGLPELHCVAATTFRRDLDRVLGGFVSDGAWTMGDAERVAALIGVGNARRVYQLDER